jgi:hypothetical protein
MALLHGKEILPCHPWGGFLIEQKGKISCWGVNKIKN